MLRSIMRIPTLLSLHVAFALIASPVCGEQPASAERNSQPTMTMLYHDFDGEKLGSRHVSSFGKHAEFNAVSNFKVTPPGRWFKTFRIKGNIPADNPKPILKSAQRDLEQLVTQAGVKVVEKQDSIDARPILLLKTLFPTYLMKISSIQGCHISYRDETTSGEIDLFAFQFIDPDDGDLQWCVLCSVHEPGETTGAAISAEVE